MENPTKKWMMTGSKCLFQEYWPEIPVIFQLQPRLWIHNPTYGHTNL